LVLAPAVRVALEAEGASLASDAPFIVLQIINVLTGLIPVALKVFLEQID